MSPIQSLQEDGCKAETHSNQNPCGKYLFCPMDRRLSWNLKKILVLMLSSRTTAAGLTGPHPQIII